MPIKSRVDMTPIGKTYNHLTVLSFFQETIRKKKVKWFVCKCICGGEKSIRSSLVISGSVKSCGCKRWEPIRLGATAYSMSKFPYPAEKKRYSGYKVDAKRNHRKFDISFEIFLEMISSICFYCGDPPSYRIFNKTKNRSVLANGIDRIDSSLGYEIGNVVSCCRVCNMMKNTLSEKVFLDHVSKIAANTIGKKV